MVSAISICLLALGLSATYGQYINDVESAENPISDRRTFKHSKPIKLLPLIKKHKKFNKIIPHVFAKTPYTEVPIIHEVSRPIYKVYRYQGIEVKPVSDVTFSTPEPIIESHSIEPPQEEFIASFSSDHSLSTPSHSPSILFYPIKEKAIFSSPIFAPIPPLPPKQISSFIPPQPVLSSIPITFSPISLPRPAANLIPAFHPPVFTSIPASFPTNSPPPPPPPPPQSFFAPGPIKIQAPIQLPLPASSPAPIFQSVPTKIPEPVLPQISGPTPSNVFSPVSVKIPAPAIPSISTPTLAPVLPSFSTVSPTGGPAFSSFPVSLPPIKYSAIPTPAPSFASIPLSQPANPEPEYSYPSSGAPIPSYIKDISLGEIEIKGTSPSTTEIPKYEEATSTFSDDGSKNIEQIIKNENGIFQKIKGWKADKANAALSHFTNFKQKPFFQPSVSISQPPNKIPIDISIPQVPIYPNFPFHQGPNHPLPPAPAPAFFPSAPFFPSVRYENFPPNNIESPPLLNSYGTPISQDSYASLHAPHDRFSTAASEEEPAILPVPSAEKKEQNLENQQKPSRPEFQPQFQPQALPHNHPVYVPEESKTVKEENKTTEDTQSEVENYEIQRETNSDAASNVHNYSNHKE